MHGSSLGMQKWSECTETRANACIYLTLTKNFLTTRFQADRCQKKKGFQADQGNKNHTLAIWSKSKCLQNLHI